METPPMRFIGRNAARAAADIDAASQAILNDAAGRAPDAVSISCAMGPQATFVLGRRQNIRDAMRRAHDKRLENPVLDLASI
jgi:hypothetical protein